LLHRNRYRRDLGADAHLLALARRSRRSVQSRLFGLLEDLGGRVVFLRLLGELGVGLGGRSLARDFAAADLGQELALIANLPAEMFLEVRLHVGTRQDLAGAHRRAAMQRLLEIVLHRFGGLIAFRAIVL